VEDDRHKSGCVFVTGAQRRAWQRIDVDIGVDFKIGKVIGGGRGILLGG
jgi:hypothetical protein